MDSQPLKDEYEWVIVVPDLPPQEADKKFNQWKQELGQAVLPNDARRDQIFGGPGQGCVVRYSVRRASL